MSHNLIFVNLPVANIEASRTYFSALGYTFNETFCDASTLCLVLGDTIFAMLIEREKFAEFTPRPVADATAASEVLVALSAESREEVDALVDKAVAAGGSDVRKEDLGFMYGRAYSDLDGHIWEVMWMDPAAASGDFSKFEGASA